MSTKRTRKAKKHTSKKSKKRASKKDIIFSRTLFASVMIKNKKVSIETDVTFVNDIVLYDEDFAAAIAPEFRAALEQNLIAQIESILNASTTEIEVK